MVGMPGAGSVGERCASVCECVVCNLFRLFHFRFAWQASTMACSWAPTSAPPPPGASNAPCAADSAAGLDVSHAGLTGAGGAVVDERRGGGAGDGEAERRRGELAVDVALTRVRGVFLNFEGDPLSVLVVLDALASLQDDEVSGGNRTR